MSGRYYWHIIQIVWHQQSPEVIVVLRPFADERMSWRVPSVRKAVGC